MAAGHGSGTPLGPADLIGVGVFYSLSFLYFRIYQLDRDLAFFSGFFFDYFGRVQAFPLEDFITLERRFLKPTPTPPPLLPDHIILQHFRPPHILHRPHLEDRNFDLGRWW